MLRSISFTPSARTPLFRTLLRVLLLAVVSSLAGVSSAQQAEPGYGLAAGDRVKTFVLGEPDLSVEVDVSDEGKIWFPLLGELQVAGLTAKQVEDLITEQLRGDYLVDPRVSVEISGYRKIFVDGAIRNPGAYQYVPGLTVRQAIALAGGFTDLASRSKIFVISETDSTGDRRKVSLNDTVSPGDIITIDESFF